MKMATPQARKRRPNFSEHELHEIVTVVFEKYDILFGKFYFDSDSCNKDEEYRLAACN